jgi:hypothetical protein
MSSEVDINDYIKQRTAEQEQLEKKVKEIENSKVKFINEQLDNKIDKEKVKRIIEISSVIGRLIDESHRDNSESQLYTIFDRIHKRFFNDKRHTGLEVPKRLLDNALDYRYNKNPRYIVLYRNGLGYVSSSKPTKDYTRPYDLHGLYKISEVFKEHPDIWKSVQNGYKRDAYKILMDIYSKTNSVTEVLESIKIEQNISNPYPIGIQYYTKDSAGIEDVRDNCFDRIHKIGFINIGNVSVISGYYGGRIRMIIRDTNSSLVKEISISENMSEENYVILSTIPIDIIKKLENIVEQTKSIDETNKNMLERAKNELGVYILAEMI